jgi:hypothetical protein
MSEIRGNYGKSKNKNFFIYDSIGVPHPYCIGPRHVVNAADNFSGILNKACIVDGERKGITCAAKGCYLQYECHEEALIIGCKIDFKTDKAAEKELKKYLKGIVKETEDNNYAGFTFMLTDKEKP